MGMVVQSIRFTTSFPSLTCLLPRIKATLTLCTVQCESVENGQFLSSQNGEKSNTNLNMASSPSAFHDMYTTFVASVHSVGTACTLASVGIYLHRRGFVYGDGKKVLALISQQVTIPLFLFTKVVYCNQDWSDAPCPNVTEKLNDIWVLLFWPAYV